MENEETPEADQETEQDPERRRLFEEACEEVIRDHAEILRDLADV